MREWGATEELCEKSENERGLLGRVVEEHKGLYHIITEAGYIIGKPAGKMIYEALDKSDFPAVGDWVQILDGHDEKRYDEARQVEANLATDNMEPDNRNIDNNRPEEISKGMIVKVHERKSKFARKIAGSRFDEQIVASNMDDIAICMGINHDYNIKRLERYLALAWESGANPVIILTKVDLAEDREQLISDVEAVSFGVPIIELSSVTGEGVQEVEALLTQGKTMGLIGSSGVGKSTLINTLLNDQVQKTNMTMVDNRGKHTTTFRKLIQLNNGAVIVDTPGMKSVGLLDNTEGFNETYADIIELETTCKFSNCQHKSEPGCGIKQALEDGSLDEARYANYLKLKKEIAFAERKRKMRLLREEKLKNKNKNRRE